MATLEQVPVPPVTLRPAAPDDAAVLQRWRAEWSVRRFQPLHDLSVAQLRTDLSSQSLEDLHAGRGEKFQWIVLVAGEPSGWITLVVSNWEHGIAEVGYALTTGVQRRGVMVEALGQLLDHLFEHTSLERVEARCAVDNRPSRRVLEKRGFVREGLLRGYFRLRGERTDNLLYSLLRDDWRGTP